MKIGIQNVKLSKDEAGYDLVSFTIKDYAGEEHKLTERVKDGKVNRDISLAVSDPNLFRKAILEAATRELHDELDEELAAIYGGAQ